jgi:hypothetical protein
MAGAGSRPGAGAPDVGKVLPTYWEIEMKNGWRGQSPGIAAAA